VLTVLGAVAIVMGAFLAIFQDDIKLMLAYSTISNIGYIVLGIGLASPFALIGAFVHVFNHALIKVTLFLAAGAIIHQTGHRTLSDLRGRAAHAADRRSDGDRRGVDRRPAADGRLRVQVVHRARRLRGRPRSVRLRARVRRALHLRLLRAHARRVLLPAPVRPEVAARSRRPGPCAPPCWCWRRRVWCWACWAAYRSPSSSPRWSTCSPRWGADVDVVDPRPLLAPLVSFACAGLVFAVGENVFWRRFWSFLAAGVKLLLVLSMLPGTLAGTVYVSHVVTFTPGVSIALRADAYGMFFALVSSTLWVLTTVYAIGYMRGDKDRVRFFGFFALCVSTTVGIAFAENLLTFFLFYETLTICTYPLVVHAETPQALRAGRIYLTYTLLGGGFALIGSVMTLDLAGTLTLSQHGVFAPDTPTASRSRRSSWRSSSASASRPRSCRCTAGCRSPWSRRRP
jgi:hypothetical protein